MNKNCENCGHPLQEGAKFCVNFGQSVNVENEKQNITTENQKDLEKESVTLNNQKEQKKKVLL